MYILLSYYYLCHRRYQYDYKKYLDNIALNEMFFLFIFLKKLKKRLRD